MMTPRTPSTRLALPLLALLGLSPTLAQEAPSHGPTPAAHTPATGAPAEPPERALLYAIETGVNTVYVLGSVHLLRPEAYPLPDVVDQAYADAEVLAFEIDLDAANEAAATMMQRGAFDDGRTLRDAISPELFDRLAAVLDSLGVPADAFASMKPWMASAALFPVALQNGGFEIAPGVDQHLHGRAQDDGKRRVALETADEQVDVLDTLTPAQQEALLQATVERHASLADELDASTAAWLAGDTGTLEELLMAWAEDVPGLGEALFFRRNRAWVPDVEALLGRPGEDALVVVGAGHLVGAQGLIALLQSRGHAVTQL